MREIYERSARTLTVSFLDGTEALAAPATARWKLWNKTAKTEVVAWTAISTPSTSESITITGTQNQIRSGRDREVMELMVQSDYDNENLIQTQVFRYAIKNLGGIDDSTGA